MNRPHPRHLVAAAAVLALAVTSVVVVDLLCLGRSAEAEAGATDGRSGGDGGEGGSRGSDTSDDSSDDTSDDTGSPAGRQPAIVLAFAGDLHFEGALAGLPGDADADLGAMADNLRGADLAIVNLETAIVDGTVQRAPKEQEDPGNRYWFGAPPETLDLLARSGVDVASLANNHGADYGKIGLRAALRAEAGSDLDLVGVGRTPERAYAPHRTTIRGTDVAVIAADASPRESADQTWAIDEGTGIGLAAARRPRAPQLVAAVREAAAVDDVVVVYLHWGAEGRAAPTDKQQQLAARLADAGADVIVGSHSHVVAGAGMLGDTYVSYGLGNFAWYHGRSDGGSTGVLRVRVRDGEAVKHRWWPASIPAAGGVPTRPAAAQAQRDDVVRRWRRLGLEAGLEPLPLT